MSKMKVTMMDYDSSLKVKHFSKSASPKPVPLNRAINLHTSVFYKVKGLQAGVQ